MSVAAAPTSSLTRREATLRRLVRRNRLVAVLRLAVPAVGIAAFAALAAQIYLSNLLKQYGVSNIRIERGGLSLDTPTYTSVGADGSRYVVNAREAHSPLASPDLIDLTDARLDFTRPGQPTFHATSPTASIDTSTQKVFVPGVAQVTRDDGMHGTLTEVHADIEAGTILSKGPVDITTADGMLIVAGNMFYDGKTWTFERSTVTMQGLPEAAAKPTP